MELKEILNKVQWEFKNHRKMFFIVAGVLIFLGAEIALTVALRSSLTGTKAQLRDRTQEMEMSKSTGLAQITPVELDKLQKRMSSFKDGFVGAAEISAVLNRISDQAEKNNVRVVSINSDNPVAMKTDAAPEQKFTQFPIRMVLEGRYQSLTEFLHSLERSSHQVFVVESYKITKTKEVNVLNCEMVLSFFSGT